MRSVPLIFDAANTCRGRPAHLTKDFTMRTFSRFLLLLSALCLTVGCSQETLDKAKDAGQATGEALESAAQDAAENVKEGAEKVEHHLKDNDGEATP